MHQATLTGKKQKAVKPLPGPNLCSQVGENVSMLLRAALSEMCEHRDGSVSLAEINHIFDLVLNSKEIFSIYQSGYSNCVGLKGSSQFIQVDEDVIMSFVVGAYCRDVLGSVFHDVAIGRDVPWRSAFINEFTAILADTVDPQARHNLFGAYRKLVAQYAGALTPVTILNASDIVGAFAGTMSALKKMVERDTDVAGLIESALNRAISHAPRVKGPAGEGIRRSRVSEFIGALYAPSTANPFRNLVLNSSACA